VEREANTKSRPEWACWRAPSRRLAAPDLDRQELAAIFAGGCVGALARAALAQSLLTRSDEWPWATFAVNLLGAALLGFFVTRLQERLPPSLYRRAFLATGVCGALTTFSTVMVELVAMLERGHVVLASVYACASLVGGFVAIFLSTKLVRRARLTA